MAEGGVSLPDSNRWNLRRLTLEVVTDEDQCREWCRANRLVPREAKCPQHKSPMSFATDHGFGMFRCRKRPHGDKDDLNVAAAKGTWFENAKCGAMKVILMTYGFSRNMGYEDAKLESSLPGNVTSDETICDWYSYCREVCLSALDRKYATEGQIGGEGQVVEIDETYFGHRKYNVGRFKKPTWILGMVGREGGYRLEVCPEGKRDAQTLLPLIQKHVKLGTTIITDKWQAYNDLTKIGYEHKSVNHKLNFVDPENKEVHTQNIESSWRPLKYRLKRTGIKEKDLGMHLCQFLWYKEIKARNLDPFLTLIEDIKLLYPIK